MNTLCFDSRASEYKKPFGAVAVGTAVDFSIKIRRDRPANSVKLITAYDDGKETETEMQWSDTQLSLDVFSCTFKPTGSGLCFYYFRLDFKDNSQYICCGENSKGIITDQKELPFQLTVYEKDYKTPDWLKGGVLYQIFPDRFVRVGDFPEDTTGKRTYLRVWGNLTAQPEDGTYRSNDYFGGNLKGIISKLPYLSSLGVTGVYLNPIFYAHSYHRYNTSDFMRVDPLLGSEEDLKLLCSEAKKYGIGIILDGVFSHTGTDSIYFNKEGSYEQPGAYQSKTSEYYDWYDFEEWPDKYRCWWGIEELPQINTDNPKFLDYMTGENGVISHWMDCGISGWRLDVADELTEVLIENLRKAIKKKNKNGILIGEVWEDASNKVSYGRRRKYLLGRQLDSVMNYPWRTAIIDYLKSGNCEELTESVLTIIENYPKETVDSLYNMLSTHDTVRIITCLAGENSVGKNIAWKQNTRLNPENRAKGIHLVKLAETILYLLPGVPCIYYGDETGLEGYEDPFNRRCFDWGSENKELIEWFKKLGKLREICPALKDGSYRQLASNGGLFAFERESRGSSITLAVNMGHCNESLDVDSEPLITLGNAYCTDGKLTLSPESLMIFASGEWALKFNK